MLLPSEQYCYKTLLEIAKKIAPFDNIITIVNILLNRTMCFTENMLLFFKGLANSYK